MNPLNVKDIRKPFHTVIQWIAAYYKKLESLPVKSQVNPREIYDQLPTHAPLEGEPLEAILKDLDDIILPGITHWQHPNFHAYFPANSSLESVLGETITATLGAQCMIWETSPAAAELEERIMEWLRDAMGLPATFEGVIQDTASTATLTALLTAREVKTDFRSNEDGVPSNLRVYCSAEAHSSIDKAVAISGIGRRNLVKIPTDKQLRMLPEALETQIISDLKQGFLPCCVVAALGTTGTVAIDPLKPIGEICQRHKVWLHVDAAYAGTALLLPDYQWMIEGIENADSFVFNPHKWMFTNFDCSVYFIKDVKSLTRTFDILPEYLRTNTRGQVNDYRDWGIPLGRRFRALKLWFVIRGYGMNGIRDTLRKHIALMDLFSQELVKNKGFELMSGPFLNFCCFRYKPDTLQNADDLNKLNKELLEAINARGEIFLTHTRIHDQYVLRMVIGQTYVEEKHIHKALRVISESVLYFALTLLSPIFTL